MERKYETMCYDTLNKRFWSFERGPIDKGGPHQFCFPVPADAVERAILYLNDMAEAPFDKVVCTFLDFCRERN